MLFLSHMRFNLAVCFCIHCFIHCRRIWFVVTFSSYKTKKKGKKILELFVGWFFFLLTALEKEYALVGTSDNNGKRW